MPAHPSRPARPSPGDRPRSHHPAVRGERPTACCQDIEHTSSRRRSTTGACRGRHALCPCTPPSPRGAAFAGRRPHGGHLPREGWRNQWALHVAGALPRRRAHLGASSPPTSHDPPSDTRCHACTGQLASPADGGITRSWPHQRGGSPTGPQGPDHRSRPRTADDLSRPATTRQGGDASPLPVRHAWIAGVFFPGDSSTRFSNSAVSCRH